MASIPTLASMMLQLSPDIQPYSDALLKANRIQGGNINNQTALLQLEEARRQQQTAAAVRQAYQENPSLLGLGGGGGGGPQSLLGSPDLAMGGGGPMTQQTVMPGQPPGAPQVVPGGMDLSRFATGQAPAGPQATLATLGAQPRQDPLEAIARQNSDAALQIMGQRFKLQEQQLGMRAKVADAVGQRFQGVTDQASYDEARADLQSFAPQLAARLPQVYNKETVAQLQQQALSVKDRLTLEAQGIQAQAELQRARMSGRVATTDQYLKALGVRPGEETPEDMQKALAWQQQDEIARQAAHGQGQIKETQFGLTRIGKSGEPEFIKGPGGGPLYGKPTEAEQRAASFSARAKAAHDNAVALEEKGLTPGIWSKVGEALPFGLGNYLVGEDQQRYRQAVSQFAQALLRKESGAAISPTEYTMTETTYFPQPGNSKKVIEDKRRERERIIQEMQEEGKGTGRTGSQGQPTPSGGQPRAEPTAQGPATFDRADFLRWRQGTGKTGNPTAADVEAYFAAKGLKRR